MKPLEWDLMTIARRYATLKQWDFSDQPGSRAEWVEMTWEDLPIAIRRVLKQTRG